MPYLHQYMPTGYILRHIQLGTPGSCCPPCRCSPDTSELEADPRKRYSHPAVLKACSNPRVGEAMRAACTDYVAPTKGKSDADKKKKPCRDFARGLRPGGDCQCGEKCQHHNSL